MSPLFLLAADFIEKMTNPALGRLQNEDYAIKFGELLADESVFSLLRDEATKITEVSTFSSAGWFWILGWANSQKISLQEGLLLQLATNYRSISMLTYLIRIAPLDEETDPKSGKWVLDFPNSWLQQLALSCILPPPAEKEVNSSSDSNREARIDYRYAENILLALIQVGVPVTLAAARAFLEFPWVGSESLDQSYRAYLSLLDIETQASLNEILRYNK